MNAKVEEPTTSVVTGTSKGGGEMDARLTQLGYATSTQLSGQSRLGGKVFAGYRWNLLEVELGYADLGRMDTRVVGPSPVTDDYLRAISRSQPQSGAGPQLSGVLHWPVHERVDVFGRLGLFYWRSTMSADDTAQFSSARDRALDPFAGLGIGYRASQRWSLQAEWNRYDLAGESVNALGLAVQRRFGGSEPGYRAAR